ncbi:maltokinase N-terminal cap-like domain-containing protein [Streptomyces marispadix]|uniref:Maltokinase n=1 Tax=Streptomyces marispadix TaxID=2922868 RepID=A0ABS9T2F7_9ACTN|nr:phosphotransferase [Streptomyces marispadix]MCH6162719.1 phosphotransferase [Streptomyces marispadix]
MSESSLSRTALRTDTVLSAGELLGPLSRPLAEWLPRQRWFAGKGRPISGFALVAATGLLPCDGTGDAPGLIHLLVRARQSGSDAESADCYQLLLGVRDAASPLPPVDDGSLIGRLSGGPLHGRVVHEALHDPLLAAHLLERITTPGSLGPLRFRLGPDATAPRGLAPRPLAAEQSNSSVVYGDRYILKLFRRVEPGVNPDLELPLALARHGSRRVPAPTAWFEAEVPAPAGDRSEVAAGPEAVSVSATGAAVPVGTADTQDVKGAAVAVGTADTARPPAGAMTLGVLQPYLPGCRDGWQLALNALAERRDFTAEARGLGRATAEVHTGLARALPTCVLARDALESTAAAMTERLDAAGRAVPELRPYRPGLRDAFRALAALGRYGHTCHAQRVHGDLHLGQVLSGPEGHWSLIDFEGEPARPLAERRVPQPVVRDIAGMLRSFDYAACQRPWAEPDARSGTGSGSRAGSETGSGEEFARRWAAANRAAFCAGYAEASGSDPRDEATLLRAYETDKTVYEVLYEARHRPTWLHVPMSAIRRLAAAPPHP